MIRDEDEAAERRLTVIVPVYNSAGTLAACLDALHASTPIPDVVVVDDGSQDGSGDVARAAGCQVVWIEDGPRGPAHARNQGVAATTGEYVAFVDSDVLVEPDALQRLVTPLRTDPDLVATFGSYDDAPRDQSWVSSYANLRHHHVHQNSTTNADTFWAGLGCVRRKAFAAVGGFDADYGRPSIEDIELGMRLHERGGRIRLVREAQGKHLKRWTLYQLWVTDVQDRAMAWSKLLVRRSASSQTLNLGRKQRMSAGLALLTVAAALSAVTFGHWLPAAVAAIALIGWIATEASFLDLLWRRTGPAGSLVGGALHFCYYLYSSCVYASVAAVSRIRASASTSG